MAFTGKENYIKVEIAQLTGVITITVTITDSSDNVLAKYTVSHGEVDSSNILTFGAIDESYARKTEIESLQSTIEELTSRIAVLESQFFFLLKMAWGNTI